MLNEFKQHLSIYLEDSEINQLIESLENERLQGLLLNVDRCSEQLLLKYFPQLIKHEFIKNAYIYNPKEIHPGKHFLFNSGAYYLQDLSAMLVAYFLDINDGDIVADLCSAPGGKTYQAAIKNKHALVIANDISGLRAKDLASNIERFGLSNVIVANEDALVLIKKAPYLFDKIILDAPCSGSGMFRKNDLMIKDWSLNKVLKYQSIQKELIITSYNHLKPGGQLIYSTCSFSYEEDEAVIEYLLANTDAKTINLPDHHRFTNSKIVPGSIHLFPHKFEGDGHYICLVTKPGNIEKNTLTSPRINRFGSFDLQLEIYQKNQHYFGLMTNIKLPFNLVRAGIFLGEKRGKITIYNHHLSLYLPPSLSQSLDQAEKEKYLRGETFINRSFPDGYYPVSFEGINLGFVKVKDGYVKNHYPKGLRTR